MAQLKAPTTPPLARMPSGIPGLDTILHGGFLEGGIFIVQGPPGTGKTIFGNQICFNHVARGGRALYVTLLAESHARMLLHIGQLGFFDESKIPDHLFYISAFGALEEDGLDGLLTLLRREVAQREATVLVLDGLVAAGETAQSDREFKKFINALQTQAALADCTMFLLTSAQADNSIPPEQTMVDGLIELSSRLYGWRAERDLQLLKARGGGHLRGRHAFRITDAGIIVYPRIEALLAEPSRRDNVDGPGVATGIARLDEMTGGGLPRHSTTMLVGPSGGGKTSIGLHFLAGSGAEEPGLLFGLYETPAGVLSKARALGLPLEELVKAGHVELLWHPTTEGVLDEICLHLLEAVRRRRVRRLVLDGLGGLMKLAPHAERVGHIVSALVNEFRALGVTGLFTQETTELVGPTTSLPLSGLSLHGVSSLTENVIVLRFVELRSQLHRIISVLKVRDHAISSGVRIFSIGSDGVEIDPDSASAEEILRQVAQDRNSEI
jgi:circadian clock protein KaiC